MNPRLTTTDALVSLAAAIKAWGRELGFQRIGIADPDLTDAEARLLEWLAAGFHGTMTYMARHGVKRSRPAVLVPGTVRVITARLDYLPPDAAAPWSVLRQPELAYVSRYALGRDYHKVLRQRLQRLADHITTAIGPFGYRVFTDSAPVLEKALAEKAGLGWIGKHSNLLDRRAGSWFFLGEIYVDLPLPTDTPTTSHCGRCVACLDLCPTQAIVAPYRVDARRCISYHTIELAGPIPLEFRRAMGNRIYGCDDCQLVCPWNRWARPTVAADFRVRHGLDAPTLVELFGWDEPEFLHRTAGSAIRRIGHERWLRNIAVSLGNAPPTPPVSAALQARRAHPSALVREHVAWALTAQATADPATPPRSASAAADPGPLTGCAHRP
ncbi:MAG: tRNA epoxyqueuosine(34) reductase QueG [Candidatus Contendobacter sp.]